MQHTNSGLSFTTLIKHDSTTSLFPFLKHKNTSKRHKLAPHLECAFNKKDAM